MKRKIIVTASFLTLLFPCAVKGYESSYPDRDSTESSSFLQKQTKIPWDQVNAKILGDLYYEKTGVLLVDGYRINPSGGNFPIDFCEPPKDWDNLIQRCAEGRVSSIIPKESIHDDVCFNIAAQLGFFDTSGNDGRPDGQLRHLGREMQKKGIDIHPACDLFKKLGYPARISFSRWKEILDF